MVRAKRIWINGSDVRALSFEAGAKEVWLCEQTGKLRFFLKKSRKVDAGASGLCPGMAGQVGN